MFSSPIVNVALGLVLMYLMLSLLCTAVNEFLATLTNLRARYLRTAIDWLLHDEDLKKKFHANGLVQAMQPRPGMLRRTPEIARATSQAPGKALRRLAKKPPPTPAVKADGAGSKEEPKWYASYIDGKTFASALLSSLESMGQSLDPAALKLAAADYQNHHMGRVLGDVLRFEADVADTDIQKLKDALASWFDKSMEQLSGVYKRRMKWVSLGIGIVVAVALNANSITVAQRLWQSPDLQKQTAALAQKMVKQPPAALQGVASGADPAAPQVMLAATTTAAGGSAGAATGQSAKSLAELLRGQADEILKQYQAINASFPLGYGFFQMPQKFTGWLIVIFGLLVTGVALSLGAPFWFDLLSYIVKMRNESDPPAPGDKDKAAKPTGS